MEVQFPDGNIVYEETKRYQRGDYKFAVVYQKAGENWKMWELVENEQEAANECAEWNSENRQFAYVAIHRVPCDYWCPCCPKSEQQIADRNARFNARMAGAK